MTPHTPQPDLPSALNAALDQLLPRQPRMQQWQCEDGYLVGYTTERFGTGTNPFGVCDQPPGTGTFGFYLYKPTGPGARSGAASTFVLVRHRYLAKRKHAKRLAILEFYRRSPTVRARLEARGLRLNPRTGQWERP